jgi:hypothetical protein
MGLPEPGYRLYGLDRRGGKSGGGAAVASQPQRWGGHIMATIAYNYACEFTAGFVQVPSEEQRVGYVTAFEGLGLSQALKADLTIIDPQTVANVTVVGVIEQFEWNGGVGNPLEIQMYVSQENAVQLKTLQQATQKTTSVSALNYLILDYDQEVKRWFTQAAPAQPPLSGIVAGGSNPELNVDMTSVPVKDGIDVYVYKVTVQIAPPANKAYALTFANSATTPVTKAWGLVVGSTASAQV